MEIQVAEPDHIIKHMFYSWDWESGLLLIAPNLIDKYFFCIDEIKYETFANSLNISKVQNPCENFTNGLMGRPKKATFSGLQLPNYGPFIKKKIVILRGKTESKQTT